MTTQKNFKPISSESMGAYKKEVQNIVKETVGRALEFKEECEQHGDKAEQLIAMGLQFTTNMLEAIMASGNVALMEDQLSWAMDRLPHDGVAHKHMIHRLEILSEVANEKLPADNSAEIVPYIKHMVARSEELSKQ